MNKKALVIGGGIAGCAASYFLAKKKFSVDLVEAGPVLGAGNKTQWFGGHPHTFGPRHIVTKDRDVFDFMDKMSPMRKLKNYQLWNYQHEEKTFFNYPVNKRDIESFDRKIEIEKELSILSENTIAVDKLKNFEEYWRASIGDILYEKFIGPYSKKMWPEIENTQIDDFSWSPKGSPLRSGGYDVYPESDGWIVAYPDSPNGYDPYFSLLTANVNVCINTEIKIYNTLSKKFFFNEEWHKYDVVVSSISPDNLFNSCYGRLGFMGRDLEMIVLPIENLFPPDVYMLHYPGPEKYTRIVEYKKFTNFKSKNTLLGVEYPSKNGKHYPMPLKSEQNKARKYFELMPDGVFNVGRAGSYHYSIDIDDSVNQAMDIYNLL